jgi:hypothetical protein
VTETDPCPDPCHGPFPWSRPGAPKASELDEETVIETVIEGVLEGVIESAIERESDRRALPQGTAERDRGHGKGVICFEVYEDLTRPCHPGPAEASACNSSHRHALATTFDPNLEHCAAQLCRECHPHLRLCQPRSQLDGLGYDLGLGLGCDFDCDCDFDFC